MRCERYDLTNDGRVYMDCYIQDWTPVKPFLPVRPAIVICPGGAYIMISQREGEAVALAFAAKGYNAFVLNYSIGFYARFPAPVVDAAKAVKVIRENASKWCIDPNKIAISGFSAGGHTASCLATMYDRPDIYQAAEATPEEIRPNALILGYSVTTVDKKAMEGLFRYLAADRDIDEIQKTCSASEYVSPSTPPAFVFAFYDDKLVPLEQSTVFCNAMARYDVPFELHIFGHGEHGCSLGDCAAALGEDNLYDNSVSMWMELCINWLTKLFGSPVLGCKYESMLKSSATNRAHCNEGILPLNLFQDMVRRKTPGKRLSLSTCLEDVINQPGGTEVLREYFPEIIASPRAKQLYELPIQALVLSMGGAMDSKKTIELAKALRNIPV